MKSQIKTVVSLTVICAVVAVLLAVTNYITAPIIKKNEAAQVSGALRKERRLRFQNANIGLRL